MGRAARLGGIVTPSIPAWEGERTLKAELASYHAVPLTPVGRLYLTDRRIAWSPLFFFAWPLFRKPVVIVLSNVTKCLIVRFMLSYTLTVHANNERYQFFIGWSFMKGPAESWLNRVERAVRAVKRDNVGLQS